MKPWLNAPWIKIKLQEGHKENVGQNGTTMEKVVDLLIGRLSTYEKGVYKNKDNELALMYLQEAREALKRRGTVYDD